MEAFNVAITKYHIVYEHFDYEISEVFEILINIIQFSLGFAHNFRFALTSSLLI